jgi:hypothetical protein
MEGLAPVLGVLSQLAMGLSLAACAGLRAFLPLFAVGLAGRLDWIPLTSHFEWLESTPSLVVLGAAVIAELVADKVPWFDHLLDLLQSFVKPVAGAIAVAAVLHELTPLQGAVLALVLGGGIAGAVHVGKANLRLLSTASTGGLANPAVSVVEEGGAWSLALAAIWAPLAAAAVLLGLFLVAIWWMRKRRRFRAVRLEGSR